MCTGVEFGFERAIIQTQLIGEKDIEFALI